MKRSGKVVLWLAACIVLLVLVGATGFTAANYWEFRGQTSQDSEAGARVTIWVDTNWKSLSVLGIRLYTRSSRPYSVSVGFYTNTTTSTIATALVEKVTIRYDDGDVRRVVEQPADTKRWAFSQHRYSNWSSNGLVYHNVWRAGGLLTNCVDRNEPFVLECKGKLQHTNGEEIPFDIHWSFRPNKVSGIFSGWHFRMPFDPP